MTNLTFKVSSMEICYVIYIENIAVMDNFPTPEFPYSVTWLFSYELNKEEIFKNYVLALYGG